MKMDRFSSTLDTETFKIYDVEEGKVVHSEVVDTNGSGHALAGVLNALNADV